MTKRLGLLAVASIAVFSLVACKGGGSPPSPAAITASGPSSSATSKQGAYLTFVIGSLTSTSATTRKPQFVSRSIQSAVATVFQQTGGVGPYNVQAAQS